MLDLDYNLPVQVRDHALGVEDEALPESDVGREFALERMANEGELGAAFTGSGGKPNDTILQLQRTNPYYQVMFSTLIFTCLLPYEACHCHKLMTIKAVDLQLADWTILQHIYTVQIFINIPCKSHINRALCEPQLARKPA